MSENVGARVLDAIIDALAERAAQGEAVALLWDMDGTLVDTRLRMLTAVHAYGRTDVRVSQVTTSWQETAARLKLDPVRFATVWQRVFWAYESFDADSEIVATAERARRAEKLGIQNIVVTGRIEELRGVTARQLDRLGLHPTRMFLKATTGDITPAVKAEVIAALAAEGLSLGAFVTDSREEIQAALGPGMLEKAPGLQCIFVDFENAVPGGAPDGAVLFTVPAAHPEDVAEVAEELTAHGAPGAIQFGFEAEYAIDDADRLLKLYTPDATAGIEASKWVAWSAAERAAWVRAQFPPIHSEEFDLPLLRGAHLPAELSWLPERIIIDSDSNVEVISPPTARLSELWSWIELLEHACGPALWQATHSVPSTAAFGGGPALDGFLSFHGFLDTFERMAIGHELYRVNSDREVLKPFAHPWLGPVTRGKHRFLRMYLEANPRGEKLDEKWSKLVKRAFSSFKYIGGSAYRPSIAGPDRVAIEVRDAHGNKALLARRLVRNVTAFVAGLEPFAPFADTWAFDSEADYDALPQAVRKMLEVVIPSLERPEIDHMYSRYDRVALQAYRHYALPMKDYGDVERALGEAPGGPEVQTRVAAQKGYLARLEEIARAFDGSPASQHRARCAVQGALAAFAVESGLYARLELFRERVTALPAMQAALARVRPLVPIAVVAPRTAWTGTLKRRLERLAREWPTAVRLVPDAELTRLAPAAAPLRRALVALSEHGLPVEERVRLRQAFSDATALDVLAVSCTDRGGLEVRMGRHLYTPGDAGVEQVERTPRTGAFEPLIALAPLEAHALRLQLARHDPSWHASRRVVASGWLRHLSLQHPLEDVLGLPAPAAIETAAQVLDLTIAAEETGRRAWIAYWTPGPLAELDTTTVSAEHSTLASGFPETLRADGPLEARLEALVGRWPGHARLVDGVPFTFGKGSQTRRVLVLALAGLCEADAERLRVDYVEAIGSDTISFPLREAADHLRTRIGTLAFAVGPDGVRVDEYQAPSGRRRIEATLALTPGEMTKLRRYVGGMIEDTLGVLGKITAAGGTRRTTGRIDDNRPRDGERHNCTTWVTLAPAGDEGQDLCTLAAMPDHWTSHDNPGWWSMFLTGASRSPRSNVVIYWTALPLAEEPLQSGQPLAWDFNPK